jgi:nifR3 family TIM-barrel protein
MFSWKEAKNPIIALAPMDGYTDSAFRQLVKSIESRTVCYTEFISSDFLYYKPKEFKKFLTFENTEQPLVVQLFGKEPEHFKIAAQVAEEAGAAAIDINMGCPARKVISSMHGAYLMKNEKLGCKIIEEVRKAIKIPLSVKTRLGWEDDKNLIPFVQHLIDAGIDMIAIHGRTYKQGFHGEANWEPIYRLKENVKIPVIGNGDVKDAKSASVKIGNLNGLMIGRASFGNPWIFKEIAISLLDAKEWKSSDITMQERLKIMQKHAELLVKTKGERKGIMESRKHMAMYIKGIRGAADFRNRLVRIENLKELDGIIREIQKGI